MSLEIAPHRIPTQNATAPQDNAATQSAIADKLLETRVRAILAE
jgi:hypothetical protein